MKKAILLLCTVIMSCTLLLAGCSEISVDVTSDGGSKKTSQVKDSLRVSVLNIGQGDAILVQTESQNILIDTGDDKYYEDSKKGKINDQLFEELEKANVTTIDKLIMTHAHSDHIGKAAKVLEKYTVNELVYNGIPSTSSYMKKAMTVAKDKKIKTTTVKAGDVLDFGNGVSFEVLSPTKKQVTADKKAITNGEKPDVNNQSIVGKLTYGNFSMLLTGDAETAIEKEMVASYGENLKVDILKAGHHGSKTSSSANLLKAAQPEAVVISAGEDNQYGHPHDVTLERYKKQNIKNIYCTKDSGTITVISDGKSYEIDTEK